MTSLLVITPVGPGHENLVKRCAESVKRLAKGPFSEVCHMRWYDPEGEHGRSKARNYSMCHSWDWYFFLDADDEIYPDAAFLAAPHLEDYDAIFGAVCVGGQITKSNQHPMTRSLLLERGARGTLSMGFFCRAEVAREISFNEDMDAGEDMDFYLRLTEKYSFIKHYKPLVNISRDPSATGPRGYDRLDWWKTCDQVVNKYRAD